jgi:hypothetical protein
LVVGSSPTRPTNLQAILSDLKISLNSFLHF